MNPLLYAHRGAAAERPENTLPAFRLALEAGANALESDLHMTRDGRLVLSHDPDGARMAGAPRAIRDSTLEEVRSWDAGWGFLDELGGRPFAGRGFRIPTLEEVLLEFPGVPLNLDLKQRVPDLVPQVLGLVRRLGAQERVRLASFSSATLRRVRRLGYEGPTGLGRSEAARLVLAPEPLLRRWPLPGTAAQLPLNVGSLRLDTRRVIERCHALGIRVDYWTVNDPSEARRLLALGADGVMTDDPRALAPVFAARLAAAGPVPRGG